MRAALHYNQQHPAIVAYMAQMAYWSYLAQRALLRHVAPDAAEEFPDPGPLRESWLEDIAIILNHDHAERQKKRSNSRMR